MAKGSSNSNSLTFPEYYDPEIENAVRQHILSEYETDDKEKVKIVLVSNTEEAELVVPLFDQYRSYN